jgi:hypothetical protein
MAKRAAYTSVFSCSAAVAAHLSNTSVPVSSRIDGWLTRPAGSRGRLMIGSFSRELRPCFLLNITVLHYLNGSGVM